MAERNTGGPAFPIPEQRRPDGEVTAYAEAGMTLRDRFAAKAMQAELTNWPTDVGDWMRERAELARRAYAMADAMLEARNA